MISVPISEINLRAVLLSIPGTVVRSVPISCFRCSATLNVYSYFLGFLREDVLETSSRGLSVLSFFLSVHHMLRFVVDKTRKLPFPVVTQTGGLLYSCPATSFELPL